MRGAGDKAFAAGTDISLFKDFSSPEQGIAYEEAGERNFELISLPAADDRGDCRRLHRRRRRHRRRLRYPDRLRAT